MSEESPVQLPFQIVLEVGDHSGDGHDRTRERVINSNRGSTLIWEAYQAGATLVGFDLVETVGVDYEDSSITEEQVEMLRKAGYDIPADTDGMGWDEYLDAFLFMVKLGDPEFTYETTRLVKMQLGGYGLV